MSNDESRQSPEAEIKITSVSTPSEFIRAGERLMEQRRQEQQQRLREQQDAQQPSA